MELVISVSQPVYNTKVYNDTVGQMMFCSAMTCSITHVYDLL